MSLEDATAAFAQDLNPTAPARAPVVDKAAKPVERMGGGELLDDEPAGGDDIPDPEEEIAEPEDVDADTDPEEGEEGPDEEDGDEDEDADDEDEEEGENLDLDTLVSVKVDGQDKEVSLKEAIDGYIRTETFHTRLNQIHEAKKAIEAEAGNVAQQRNKYSDLLETLTTQLDSLAPAEPNWDELYARDPVSAAKQERQWNKYKEQRAALDSEKERVGKEQQAEQAKQFRTWVQEERQKTFNQHQEWADEKVFKRDFSAMRTVAIGEGFSEKEFSELYDSRMVNILLKAAKYDRITSDKPKSIKAMKKPARPGAGASRTAPKDNRAQNRLSRTGSVDDAAGVFGSILSRER